MWAGGLALGLWVHATVAEVGPIRHALEVTLEPEAHHLTVVARVTLPEDIAGPVEFALHAGLSPRVSSEGTRLEALGEPIGAGRDVPVRRYRLNSEPDVRTLTVEYGGTINHRIREIGPEAARSFSVSPGIIDGAGVFLAGSSAWVPDFGADAITFEVDVRMPAGWRSVSQGRRSERVETDQGVRETWVADTPQRQVFLIAARFHEYREPGAVADAVVYLRDDDPALAGRYLGPTHRYLALYEDLIGPYPYDKFALVENFWETGYGMPSFTLLGSKVIRLPFILHSSYPHEILHNWWGNGVFVDYARGNWAEGLTTYLADHLVKEQRGQGSDYRRSTLQRYADYVQDHREFPLTEFRARHNAVSEAVGYGKTMMVFHMLRRQLGDKAFTDGLRTLYREHRFEVADWSDVKASFEAATQSDLSGFFAQWIERAGAPLLALGSAESAEHDGGHLLTLRLEQRQDEAPYRLRVPLAISLAGRAKPEERTVQLERRQQTVELALPAQPTRVMVDPRFDLFRRLDSQEIPPSLGQAFGAESLVIVLPAEAPEALQAGYRAMAQAWTRGREERSRVVLDRELDALPADAAVWVLGYRNRFRAAVETAVAPYRVTWREASLTVQGQALNQDEHAVVLAGRDGATARARVWVATDNPEAVPGLARKLPHYGKYSFLAFTGDAPDNVLKGQWPVVDSPMVANLIQDAGSASVSLEPRAPLAELPPAYSATRMLADVARLAAPEMEGRGVGTSGLDRATRYVASAFAEIGLEPAGTDGYRQPFAVDLGEPVGRVELANIVGRIPGRDPELAGQAVVIGAHYDHLGYGWPDARAGYEGARYPGADDNASGVAVLLELARYAQSWQPARTIIFAAFTAEEAGRIGANHFVATANRAPEDTIAMINLDTVGRLGTRELLALGTASAREWPHILRGAGFVTGVNVKAVPAEMGTSDHAAFLAAGIPAVQLFSGTHGDFHRPSDTAEKIEAASLVAAASVAKEALEYLANRREPLTNQLTRESVRDRDREPASGRRVTFGTVPDFTYQGEGVRLTDVNPETPAARVGLRAGDVIIAVNGDRIGDLRAYAQALRRLLPGDAIEVRYRRAGAEHLASARVRAR